MEKGRSEPFLIILSVRQLYFLHMQILATFVHIFEITILAEYSLAQLY